MNKGKRMIARFRDLADKEEGRWLKRFLGRLDRLRLVSVTDSNMKPGSYSFTTTINFQLDADGPTPNKDFEQSSKIL